MANPQGKQEDHETLLAREQEETQSKILVPAPVQATKDKKDGYNPAVGIPATLLC